MEAKARYKAKRLATEAENTQLLTSAQLFSKQSRGRFRNEGAVLSSSPGAYDRMYHRLSRRVVKDGERLAIWDSSGRLTIVDGPANPLLMSVTSELIQKFRADSSQYLIIHLKNGKTEHIPGPTSIFFDPLNYESVSIGKATNLRNDEAIVVYCSSKEDAKMERKIIFGPLLYIPTSSEWKEEFEWGSNGAFTRLKLVPENFEIDVEKVRTVDDALLTLHFMIVFQLVDIPKMLSETEDPIAAFTTAMCSDVINMSSKLTLDGFNDFTSNLSSLNSYSNLQSIADNNGFKIISVIFRGYSPTQALEKLQEKNVETRTQLKLEKETRRQKEELLSFTQHSALVRDTERREMETMQKEHLISLKQKEIEQDIKSKKVSDEYEYQSLKSKYDLELKHQMNMNNEDLRYLEALKKLNVDLTKVLVSRLEARPDRNLKVQGANGENVHFHAN